MASLSTIVDMETPVRRSAIGLFAGIGITLPAIPASAVPLSQYWFMDWARGCVKIPRPPYAQPELRGAIETVPQRFMDGGVEVIRVTFAHPYNGWRGSLVWVSDEAYCRKNFSQYLYDNRRIEVGQSPLMKGTDNSDSVDFVYEYDRIKNRDTAPKLAPTPVSPSTPPVPEPVPIPAGPDEITGPVWLRTPSPEEVMAALPLGRDYAGITGRIDLVCTATPGGRLTECVVVDARPMWMGFDQAALATVGSFLMDTKDKQGRAVGGRPVRVTLVAPITDELQSRVRTQGSE